EPAMKRSSLLRRLTRLAPHASGGAEEASPIAPTTTAAPDATVIEQLRRRMAEVMDRPVVPRRGAVVDEAPRRPAATFEDLPLVRREHESGPLWHRVVRVPLEYRVGYRTCYDVLA